MTRTMPELAPAYIIAARRTALGRIGGLHKNRRLEELAAPVVTAVLEDAGLTPDRVDEIVIGNAMHGANPARLIALASGLSEHVSAASIDRQCGSGLDAILTAVRNVGLADADVIIAGGAESISTAPWRIAKPKNLYQMPHFIGVEPTTADRADDPQLFEASEALSQRLKISREQQDTYAMQAFLRAGAAREARRFVGEIVPLRANPEEARDQSAIEPSVDALERLAPYLPPTGTLTPGNTSAMHDGAAIVAVVSQSVWEELGKPHALRLVGAASRGVGPDDEAAAPIDAMQKLYEKLSAFNPKDIGVVEMSESSAAQVIAFSSELGLATEIINPDGGAIARGHPFAAAGAVLVVRLFTRMVRDEAPEKPHYGVAALGTIGGMGMAALFEAV